MITNSESGTNVHEIAEGIYRINTPVSLPDGNEFNFNQYLITDEQSLLFHTGLRGLFPLVRDAVSSVIPVDSLHFLAVSHFEADECGALNEFLSIAPAARPLCGAISAMVSLGDYADREPRVMQDEEELVLGKHVVRWLDTPHVPHAWDCGLMMDSTTQTFFCGDLFTQGGAGEVALTESDILGPSEAFRGSMDYLAHAPATSDQLGRMASYAPTTLACMHGSAWRGDGAALLKDLAAEIERQGE
ncbi:MAG: MBL fold metallo-hydrolase [Gammaproteobacteria bacterium]|jgi:flavorubredoxin